MTRWSMLVGLAVALFAFADCRAQPTTLDPCDALDGWAVLPSDGVRASVSLAEGADGRAIRLDYNFESGSGFVVLRRPIALELPADYRFTFKVRGQSPRNNLEFKLVDPSGDNVWWVNNRAFEFPEAWRTISYKRRQLKFAWGPTAGAPLERIGAIEFAVAANAGGKGSVYFDSLTFEPLTPAAEITQVPTALFSSSDDGAPRQAPLSPGAALAWRSSPSDPAPVINLDLGQDREFGGLMIDWDREDFAVDYEVLLSRDGKAFEPCVSVTGGRGGRRFVPIPDGDGRAIRVAVRKTSRGRGVGLGGLELLGVDFSATPNSVEMEMARRARPGLFPRMFLGQQCYWTVVGVSGDTKEALINEDGAIEADKLGFTVEPAIISDGRLITWADVRATQDLSDGCLPIPNVHWDAAGLGLDITAFADGPAGSSWITARYEVRNTGAERRAGSLTLALRPFQVLPPWQELNITGGVSPIRTIQLEGRVATVNAGGRILSATAPSGFGASAFAAGDVFERLDAGERPSTSGVSDPAGLASAAWWYDFDLEPGQSRVVVLRWPLHWGAPVPTVDEPDSTVEAQTEARLQAVRRDWQSQLNRVGLTLPATARRLSDTFRTVQAHILINRDGPSIQPGSRTYERSWIRDGSLTGTALLATGHADEAREFIDWYGRFQYPSGKVPCVVDTRGPDPVPEHDSSGEFIYAVAKYYRCTGDRAFLERHLDGVTRAVDYLAGLCAQRQTPEYGEGRPEKRAMYGLVPESISHEGYSAKPMHSYWDDFFTLKGLRDARFIAAELGRKDLESRFAGMETAFSKNLGDSLRLAMKNRSIDYVPGCVELGDFDATSTAIAIFPCDLLGELPEPQLHNTFDRYFEFFEKRREGRIEWRDYTPYELRLVGTFVRLGQPERAHALLDFFFGDQRPQGWNQWAEVVWREPRRPGFVGDIPHTWVGSEFLNAARSLFAYEHGEFLVLCAGLRPEWLTDPAGVAVTGWPTEFGTLSYTVRGDQKSTEFRLGEGLRPSRSRCVLVVPGSRAIGGIDVDGEARAVPKDRLVVLDGSPTVVRVLWGS